ncbi:MAG: Gldg family protein, partial [Verrucomicrobiales bacterium]
EAKLLEFKSYSNDRIELEIIDPEPDSEEEVNANVNGVMPVPIDQNSSIYLGASVSSLDKNVPIPFLNPQNSPLLEYDIARAISEAITTKKPTLGLMTSYEMSGGAPGSQPWYIRTQLEREYIVQDIPMSTAKIDSNIDALLVIHPAGIEDDGQFAIDQYLLGGGRVIAMLDPFSLFNRQASARPQQIPGMPAPNQPVASTLGKLLDAWGVEFESVNVVADRRYINRRRPNPVFLGIPAKGISDKTAATQQIDYVEMAFAGAFYGDGAAGLTKDVLITSSEDAGTISPHVLFGGDPSTASAAFNNMQTSGKPLNLVIQLQGEFNTAFPEGLPKDESTEVSAEDADEDKEEGEEKAEPESNSLKKSEKSGTVILIADTDMITDENAAQLARLPGGQALEFPPPNGNLAFVSNLVSFLSGNTNLLEVRSRGNNARPFTEYKRLTQEAAKEQQKEYDELIAKRRTAERKYREIRSKQEKGEQVEVAELEIVRNYDEERISTGQRIVELRRELRKGIDSLEARWKWLNIALIPGLVILAAIGHLLYRKFATSAR